MEKDAKLTFDKKRTAEKAPQKKSTKSRQQSVEVIIST